MKNKILLSMLSLFLTCLTANAGIDKVHVSMVDNFDTANPAEKIDVNVIEDSTLGGHILKAGDILHCNVIKVTDPKRGKRSATFAVCPTSYTSGEETITIEESYYGKYADKVLSKEEFKNIDKVKVGKKAVLTVGSHFVKGLTTGVNLAEGMIKNEEGNRIKSGIKEVYKNSALSYTEKGEELDIESGEKFYLLFKPSKSKKAADITEEVLKEEDDKELKKTDIDQDI